MEVPATSKDPGQFMHKNRLQEYAQKSSIPLPVYEITNEGNAYAPRVRSTVLVDGMKFTSSHTFINRKAAEQDVAKLALENVSRKIEDEAIPLIFEDLIFGKSILHEYTIKMNLEKPTYTTYQVGAKLPVFTSAAIFNGQTYTGNAAKSKKEAEQMAARAVIQSILAYSDTRAVMSKIVRSKQKLYNALPLTRYSQNNSNGAVYGNEPSANLTNYTLPVSISQKYEQIAKATAAETTTRAAKEFKEGHSYESGCGTNRSGGSQPTVLQCGSLGTSSSSDGPQNNDGVKQIGPSTRLEGLSGVVLTSGMKRSDTIEKGPESKKTRTVE